MTKITLLVSTLLLLAAHSSPMARSLQEIRDSGVLNVGVAKAVPWVMSNAKGDLLGAEIDVASLLVSDLGVEEKVTVLEWSELIPALQKGDIDVIISGMSITPARALKVDFTRPYGDSALSLLARRDGPAGEASDIEAINQASVKIGSTAGTISAEVSHQLFYSAQALEFPSIKALFGELQAGNIDAMVISQPFPHLAAAEAPDKYVEPLQEPLHTQVEAMAVQQGNQSLLNFLNAWIAAKVAEGYIEKNHAYWFLSTDWFSRVTATADDKAEDAKAEGTKAEDEKDKESSTPSTTEQEKK